MLTMLRVAGALACLVFFNAFAVGQPIQSGSDMSGVHYQFQNQPFYDSANMGSTASGAPCAGEQGRRCYGQCDSTHYPQSDSCDQCGSGCNGSCNHGRHGGQGMFCGVLPWHKHDDYFRYETNLLCPGDRMYSLLAPQLMNGRLEQLAFYGFHFQWNPESQVWQLTQSGWYNVQKLARILPSTPGTIFVAPTGDPVVDESRAQVVRDAFAISGFAQYPVNVAVGQPRGMGLSGVESLIIYEQRQAGSPFTRGSNTIGSGSTFGTRITPTAGQGR